MKAKPLSILRGVSKEIKYMAMSFNFSSKYFNYNYVSANFLKKEGLCKIIVFRLTT